MFSFKRAYSLSKTNKKTITNKKPAKKFYELVAKMFKKYVKNINNDYIM